VRLVIDASLALAWLLKDEKTPEADGVALLVSEHGAWIPQLFPIEVANVLLLAERRGRISSSYAAEQLAFLQEMPLLLDDETTLRVWHETVALARTENLTVYDATYLELALRANAELATLDKDLAVAARRRGVTVLP
jgi:predicted nucleic acid-binding protein